MNKYNNSQISLKLDVVFQQFFAKKGNEELLEDFLSSILNRKVKCKTIIKESRIGQKRLDEKYGSLDIKAVLDDNVEVDIEMQMSDRKNTVNRAVYYMSTLTTEGLKPTERYSEMKQKIVIFLMNYELFKINQTVVSSYICLNENKEQELTNIQKYYFIDLTKVKYLNDKNMKRLKLWLAFFNRDKEMLDMVKEDTIMKKAEEEYEYLCGDEEVKRLAELRQRYIWEMNDSRAIGLEEGREEGRAEGRELGREEGRELGKKEGRKVGRKQGREEEKKEIAKSMLENGLSMDIIIKCTKLSKEKILKLKK